MERVPRELFAPQRFADLARTDVSLPLALRPDHDGAGARSRACWSRSALEPGQRVLEIGTGSGYVTALLAKLGGRVQTRRALRHPRRGRATRACASPAVRRPTVAVGDGLALGDESGRFDRILVNGAAKAVPPMLTSLLAPGGRLVGALPVDGPAAARPGRARRRRTAPLRPRRRRCASRRSPRAAALSL